MAVVAQPPIAAPSFSVVRRGYDPDEVTKHLNRISAETAILAADRAAAVEQSTQLSQQLDATRNELDAARAEIERLRGELRVLSGPPDSVASMNDRLQVMLRLARDEFGGMRATAAQHAAAQAAEIVAAVGAEARQMSGAEIDGGMAEAEWRGPRNEQELERMRRLAAEERVRLDAAAAAKRAEADEEFRQVLTLRCREAMAQLARLQVEALRSARQVMEQADEQARAVLTDAREAVRRTVEDAQREVDDLHALRSRLATQLDTSRKLLDRALPDPRTPAALEAAAQGNGSGAGQHAVRELERASERPGTAGTEQAANAPERGSDRAVTEKPTDKAAGLCAQETHGGGAHAARPATPMTAEQRTPASPAADSPEPAAPPAAGEVPPTPPATEARADQAGPAVPAQAPASGTPTSAAFSAAEGSIPAWAHLAATQPGSAAQEQPASQASAQQAAAPQASTQQAPAQRAPAQPSTPTQADPSAAAHARLLADTQPSHAVPGRSALDDPLYETPRAQPMRFPPADRTRKPADRATEADPERVPEPAKSPEAERSESSAPHPYL